MYNIGDRVCVKGWQHTGSRAFRLPKRYAVHFTTDMDWFIGKESTISFINRQHEPTILYELKDFKSITGSTWVFAEPWLEPVDIAEIDINEEEFDKFLNSGE